MNNNKNIGINLEEIGDALSIAIINAVYLGDEKYYREAQALAKAYTPRELQLFVSDLYDGVSGIRKHELQDVLTTKIPDDEQEGC